ncbi:MAG: two-component regulator propeller domain-containing protein [Chitinophagaceae bacterium]
MYKRILLIWLLLPGFLLLNAQPAPVQFSHIDISHGLSNNQVNCVIKDNKGFMWFGTIAGLNRYDGYSFKVFRHNVNDSSTLSDDFVNRVLEGPGNLLWIETRSGFNLYNPRTEKIDRNIGKYLTSLSLPSLAITNIIKDKTGSYWFLMGQQQLFRYDTATGKAVLVYKSADANRQVVSCSAISNGCIWMVHADGTLACINRTGTIVAQTDALAKRFQYQLLQYRLFTDAQDELWLFVNSDPRGVIHYDPAANVWDQITKDSGKERLNTNLVIGILQDNNNNIWICTDHGGINLLDKKERKVHYLLNNADDPKSLSQNSITSFYKDNNGIVWIGTYKRGLNYYHENIIKFPLYRHQASNTASLPFNDVNRFVEDAKGNLWIGTNGGGLIYYDREKNHYTRYQHSITDAGSLSNDVIVSLCIDHNQKLWIGTYFGGLDCFDGKKFTHYRHNVADTNSLADDRIWEILEDSRHNLWIGMLSGGMDRFDRQQNIFYHYPPGRPNSLQSTYVSSFLEDKSGNLWVGTSDGVDVLDLASGKFTHYSTAANAGNLSNNNTISLLQDSRGQVWVGTHDGLNVFDNKMKTFRTFRTDAGLPSNTILTMLEDDNNTIWISTPNGISAVTQNNKPVASLAIRCRNYDELDGLQGTEFNENAAYKTKKGELIFGGAEGFNLFNPAKIVSDQVVPAVALTDFQLFNKSVAIGEEYGGKVLLEQSISQTQSLTLPYNQNDISIEFAALNFSNTEKNKYAYILEGFNKEWLTGDGKIRRATYTNLDPGHYTFRVKAANESGIWNENGPVLAITILPPFWNTPLAYLLYVIAAAGILWFARRMVLQRARMRFEIEQQRQEAQRMHELDMMKIKFFTNVSHEFRTPLSLILTPLDKIIRNAAQPEQKKQFQLIHRNARRLLHLVNQLLDFRKMEVQELRLNAAQGDIVRFIKEISASFTDIAEKKHIRFRFHAEVESMLTMFDHDKLERILFNLLSNAFKFTQPGGEVAVTVSQTGEWQRILVIKVTDTGIGIPQEKQEKIFERFFQHEIPGSMVNQGSGIGLAITKEFVKMHEGSITVQSEVEKGSCFTVMLPVKKIVLQEVLAPEEEVTEEVMENEFTEEAVADTAPPIKANGKKPVLLLVEDNDDFRFYLKDNLKDLFIIHEAANGHEGWQKALAQHPDLVVSDISMPGMNGIDLCKKIKNDARTSHLPVILLTALTGEEQQLQGLETGANDYLTKPFNFEILLSRIRNILSTQARLRKTFQKQVTVQTADINVVSPDEQFILKALEVVEKNMSNADFSVEEMSKALCMSRVALYKKLLSLTGKTPIEFIRSIRLKRAAQLLEKSQLTVAEIAYEVGFNNPKYFARYFKTEFNVLPSAYVKANFKA